MRLSGAAERNEGADVGIGGGGGEELRGVVGGIEEGS